MDKNLTPFSTYQPSFQFIGVNEQIVAKVLRNFWLFAGWCFWQNQGEQITFLDSLSRQLPA